MNHIVQKNKPILRYVINSNLPDQFKNSLFREQQLIVPKKTLSQHIVCFNESKQHKLFIRTECFYTRAFVSIRNRRGGYFKIANKTIRNLLLKKSDSKVKLGLSQINKHQSRLNSFKSD